MLPSLSAAMCSPASTAHESPGAPLKTPTIIFVMTFDHPRTLVWFCAARKMSVLLSRGVITLSVPNLTALGKFDYRPSLPRSSATISDPGTNRFFIFIFLGGPAPSSKWRVNLEPRMISKGGGGQTHAGVQ